MSKFLIEPNRIYFCFDGSSLFLIRVIERCHSDYKVEIAPFPDSGYFSESDLNFEEDIDDEEA